MTRRALLPALILVVAWALRMYFFSGFVLCDDAQEFAAAEYTSVHGPSLHDQFHLRFGAWIFNALAFRLLGVTETSFFLPTLLMSVTIPLLGYAILLAWGYPVGQAFVAALMIAAAPFENLIGGMRANDMILAWLTALGLTAVFTLERRPILQGVVIAVLLWLGFYVKIWVVYALPALGLYYLVRALRHHAWRAAIAFGVVSVALHGATCLFWKAKVGDYVPFIHVHAATYPVSRAELPALLWIFPNLLLHGSSEFGTTLFGSIPRLLLAGLGLKAIGTVLPRRVTGYRLDARDGALIVYYGSFFLLLNFFPNSFAFDRYYSSPRIFRYLTPLSFPMTLHVAKMILDVARVRPGAVAARWAAFVLLAAVIGANVAQTFAATVPTRTYRTNLLAAIRDVRAIEPPRLVTESWIGYFLANVYLKDLNRKIQVIPASGTYDPAAHERWLEQRQSAFPKGTVLMTGMGSCVHYGAHRDGFRLAYFNRPLDAAWKLVRQYGMLDYLPAPEPVRLWQLSDTIAGTPPAPVAEAMRGDPRTLFLTGMGRFDAGDCPDARRYYHAIEEAFPRSPQAADAAYFDAICFFRDGQWRETIAAFEDLLRKYPDSQWIAGAYYHIGRSYDSLGETDKARANYERVREFRNEPNLPRLADERLVELGAKPTSLVDRLAKWLHLR